jgi:phosphatidylserine synthase
MRLDQNCTRCTGGVELSGTAIRVTGNYYVGFEAPAAVVMNSSVFWDITPCSPLKVNRRFVGTCRLYLQVRRISQARNQHEAGSKHIYSYLVLAIPLVVQVAIFLMDDNFPPR